MHTRHVTLQEAEAHLADLLDLVGKGEEVVIMKDNQPLARLVAEPKIGMKPRRFGQHRGKAAMSEDFDAPLSDELWAGAMGS